MSNDTTGQGKKRRVDADVETEKGTFMLVPCVFDGETDFPVTIPFLTTEPDCDQLMHAYDQHADLFEPVCDGCGADDECILCSLAPRFLLDQAVVVTEPVTESQEMLYETMRANNKPLYALLEKATRQALKKMKRGSAKAKEETAAAEHKSGGASATATATA